MISLASYRNYFEGLCTLVAGIGSVHVVSVEQDMSDKLKSLKKGDLPALFIAVPMASDNAVETDAWEEENHCLVFLMDRADPQRRLPALVLEETQPLMEGIKSAMRASKGESCHLMRGLNSMTTTPETGFYTDYCGWSLSFKLTTE